MLGTIGYYYINNIFLPVKFKHYVEVKSQEFLGRSVSIGALEFEILKGFVLSDVEIQRKDDGSKHFARFKEISFNVLFAPIFQLIIIRMRAEKLRLMSYVRRNCSTALKYKI